MKNINNPAPAAIKLIKSTFGPSELTFSASALLDELVIVEEDGETEGLLLEAAAGDEYSEEL